MLGDVDERLLEEALDLTQQPEEVILEFDERHSRRAFFGTAAAIVASLAIVVSIVFIRTNYGRIGTDPDNGSANALTSNSSSSDISESDNSADGILIPTEFTSDDLDLRSILDNSLNRAVEVTELFGYYGSSSFDTSTGRKCFLFPQMEAPITYQFDKYEYCTLSDTDSIFMRLENLFTADAVEKFMNNIAIAEVTENDADSDDRIVTILYGGVFDENDNLTEPPRIIEFSGQKFLLMGTQAPNINFYTSTAKVISRTNNEIIFSYICERNGELLQGKGRLVYENGWKYSWYEDWIF